MPAPALALWSSVHRLIEVPIYTSSQFAALETITIKQLLFYSTQNDSGAAGMNSGMWSRNLLSRAGDLHGAGQSRSGTSSETEGSVWSEYRLLDVWRENTSGRNKKERDSEDHSA